MAIGDRIKQVRGALSREEFALKIGTDKSTVQRYENEDNIPKGDILLRIHEEFGTNINWLLTGEDKPLPGEDRVEYIPGDAGVESKISPDPFGNAVSALKEIFDSHDPALIDAVRANLYIFRLYARKDRQINQQSKEIQELKKRVDTLEKRAVGNAEAGSGSHAHTGDATRKKES